MEKNIVRIAENLNLTKKQVSNTINLLSEGATIPFISRYRKEMTEGLDEVVIGNIKEQLAKWEEFEKRKAFILETLKEQGNLNDELETKIENASEISELEDIYLPFKPKRKTKATIAKERGLEPLAKLIMRQGNEDLDIAVSKFLNEDVETQEEALDGARDILAEWFSENAVARGRLRRLFIKDGIISSKIVKKNEADAEKYSDYFEHSELIRKCPSHRMLAMRRGENEGFLKLSVEPDRENAIEILETMFVKSSNDCGKQVSLAVADCYKRLLQPSMENEMKTLFKEKADEVAIMVFAENLRQLLLSPPLGEKRVLAIDPGFRTGCKLVCLDNQGKLLHNETIFPHPPQKDGKIAAKKLVSLVNSYKIDAIAIGNGTAGRETEFFIKNIAFDRKVQVFVVNEAGASIYSASKIARDEFPQFDVTVRGAVSIGRRLMDPLAELVKIEAKSIGVGQYQHDVDQGKLKNGLDQVVENCVNKVGVELNTASMHLLTYVSGLGPQLAKNIIDYRDENGPFDSRKALQKVPRLGPKAFEQAAGFLRIRDAKNPLDFTAVHPERYNLVELWAKELKCTVSELIDNEEIRVKIDIKKYVNQEVGLPTLKDIMHELAKPGRDPRTIIKVFDFAEGIHSMNDLKIGMVVPGIVTNLTNFGAFVDIGVKQDGLVHISNMADRYISNPAEVLSLNQHVMVKVVDVDVARKRIQLSMKDI
ncbi:MAG: RNA-binding transcriptional accessory protein [Bacteroidales bacterium]|nr:RNA-binding transcriptional accessory protein [Bacteroidales bacterium]